MLTKFFRSPALMTGLAMFSMFFGAGNVIFPLVIGQYAQDQTGFAIAGLLLTAVLMPFAGLIAIILFDGDYRAFFNRIGKMPGLLLASFIITLLGPLGSTPRCIALAYSTFKMSFSFLSPLWFNIVACGLIFLFTFRKNRIMNLLGYVLTPLLLLSLGMIIFKGLMTPGATAHIEQSAFATFMYGLKEGYNTMDLLAALFFSSVILASLKRKIKSDHQPYTHGQLLSLAFKSSLIGAALLALTYTGFSYIAAQHGGDLDPDHSDQLLGALTLKIIGSSAGFWVNITIALACLTTAIALISVFADFLRKDLLQEKISYELSLILSLIATFFVANFEFSGISAFLGPVLQICYPALIALTLFNIVYALQNLSKAQKALQAIKTDSISSSLEDHLS